MKKMISFWLPQLKNYLLFIFPIIFFSSCEPEPLKDNFQEIDMRSTVAAKKTNTFFGPAESFRKGVVRAMVTMTKDGKPKSIGVKISEKVLQNLPSDMEILTLRLPNKAEGMAFDHIDLDWNPGGHEPFFYKAPHFDVHFYMIPKEERMEITDPEKAAILPDPQFVPETYFLPAPDLVPFMGVHWLSSEAPELGGEDFTHTFIFGSYDGKFIFYEPMITVDYLMNHADGTLFPIAQPKKFERPGHYYPTLYSMQYDPIRKEYIIEMSGMVLH